MSQQTLKIAAAPGNLLVTVQALIESEARSQLFRATVVAITSNTIRVQRPGQEADIAAYAVLDNFPYPQVGDDVMVAKVGSGLIVIGHVLRDGLVEHYLNIETALRILPGGKITWGSDGLNFIDEDIMHFEVGGPTTAAITFSQEGEAPNSFIEAGASSTITTWRAKSEYDQLAGVSYNYGLVELNGFGRSTAGIGAFDDGVGTFIFFNTAPKPTASITVGGTAQFIVDEDGVFFLANGTAPAGNPTAGVYVWSESGVLKAKDSSGDVIKLGGGMELIVKSADEIVNNSTALQDDDDLVFPVAANELWQFEGVIYVTTGAAPDFKLQFTGPAGAVGSWNTRIYESAGTFDVTDQALGSSSTIGGSVGRVPVYFNGAIANGGTAGNLALQWAQSTADVSNTTVHAGSYIKFQKE